jgi:hypothetical protein
MANQDLTLSLRIKALVENLDKVKALNDELEKTKATSTGPVGNPFKDMTTGAETAAQQAAAVRTQQEKLAAFLGQPLPDPTQPLQAGLEATAVKAGSLVRTLADLGVAAAIAGFVASSVKEFNRMEDAYRSLEVVANGSGAGIVAAWKQANNLASDGLMTVEESAKALQNLLQRGFSLDQAVAAIKGFKDMSVLGRDANVSLGEAVIKSTEQVKNATHFWNDYAITHGKTIAELTQTEKAQAELNGILAESAGYAGQADKAAQGLGAAWGKLGNDTAIVKKELGEAVETPLLAIGKASVSAATFLVDYFLKPAIFFAKELGIVLGQLSRDNIARKQYDQDRDLAAFKAQLKANATAAEEAKVQAAKELLNPSFTPDPKAGQVPLYAPLAKQDLEELKKIVADRKKLVNEQISDANRLSQALIKSFGDSLKAEKDYRAQAEKLSAEVSAKPKDSSVEGQAIATLDLVAAQYKLLRIKNTAPLADVQAQAEQVRKLAGALDDQAVAQDAVNQSKAAERDALIKAADAEKTQQAGITEQQKQNDARLTALQSIMKNLEAGKTVVIDADTSQASTALQQIKFVLDSIQDKTVTLTVNQSGAAIPGHAAGTILPGFGGGDKNLILAEDGEAITRKEAVAYYGRDFMMRLNAMMVPRFNTGGILSNAVSSISSSATGLHPVTLNLPGVGSWPMSAAPDVVAAIKSTLAIEALKHGRRR